MWKKKSILLMITLAILLISCEEREVTPQQGEIAFVYGTVTLNGQEATAHTLLFRGDTITTKKGSLCYITVGESIIQVKEKSIIKIQDAQLIEETEQVSIALQKGKLLCRPKKLGAQEYFNIVTETAAIAVHGTEFGVTYDIKKSTRVDVIHGNVKVARNVSILDQEKINSGKYGSTITKNQSATITLKDLKVAEKKIQHALKSESDTSKILHNSQKILGVPSTHVAQAKKEEFVGDKDIIEIEEPKPLPIKRAKAVIIPSHLLVSRYKAYIIKKGKRN